MESLLGHMALRTITLGSGIRVQRGEGVRHPSLTNPKIGLYVVFHN
jgi:hypothetical protein